MRAGDRRWQHAAAARDERGSAPAAAFQQRVCRTAGAHYDAVNTPPDARRPGAREFEESHDIGGRRIRRQAAAADDPGGSSAAAAPRRRARALRAPRRRRRRRRARASAARRRRRAAAPRRREAAQRRRQFQAAPRRRRRRARATEPRRRREAALRRRRAALPWCSQQRWRRLAAQWGQRRQRQAAHRRWRAAAPRRRQRRLAAQWRRLRAAALRRQIRRSSIPGSYGYLRARGKYNDSLLLRGSVAKAVAGGGQPGAAGQRGAAPPARAAPACRRCGALRAPETSAHLPAAEIRGWRSESLCPTYRAGGARRRRAPSAPRAPPNPAPISRPSGRVARSWGVCRSRRRHRIDAAPAVAAP